MNTRHSFAAGLVALADVAAHEELAEIELGHQRRSRVKARPARKPPMSARSV